MRTTSDPRVNYAALTPYTPYITSWSSENDLPTQIVELPGRPGIGYADETIIDRDSRGALWLRTPFQPGHGQPEFARVHPLRQRRAMQRLLCNVCAGPADHTAAGTLWLVRDYRDDWPNWPERMGVNEPPVCLPCARVAARLCPALRKGAAAIRARHAPIAGVSGMVYRSGGGTAPVAIAERSVAYEDPAIHWTQAAKLLRELHDCTIVPLEDILRS